ncbi:MAG: Mrp/NBP35 family ATP-binding protein [Planctomycetes bacterium]|nr:Mrp/NBP35 family ATP-binding protein [Planctomycetota bacterium]
MFKKDLTEARVLDALRQVQDPDLHQDIVSLGFVKKVELGDDSVSVVINLTTPACPVKDQMKAQAEQLLRALPGVKTVKVEMTADVRHQAGGPPRVLAPEVRHIVAVSSGKGGVGKSTVAVNLAIALAQTGAKVGLLDCDIYGPDVPMMMGLAGAPEQVGRRLLPKERHGIKTMSIGYLLDDEKPAIWRGPMVHKLIEQFLGDVEWGPLDYLLVDMPPGTGDAQLSLAQIVPLSGAVIVTTPQAVSTFDVGKAIAMFRQVNVEVLGLVENMSGFVLEGRVEGARAGTQVKFEAGTGTQTATTNEDGRFQAVFNLFGTGGGEMLCKKHGFPMLGRVPLNPAVRVGGDAGDPVTIAQPGSPISAAFREIGGKMAQRVAIRSMQSLPILQ